MHEPQLKKIQLLTLFILSLSRGGDLYSNSWSKPVIKLTSILGITSLLLSNDWIKTIISWELKNYSLYLLVAKPGGYRSSEAGLAGAIKYFILSALSTALFLLGIAILYYLTGSTNYHDQAISIQKKRLDEEKEVGLILASGLILFTKLFKLSSAPFHNWAPDLYDGLNGQKTPYMMQIPKITVQIQLKIQGRLGFLGEPTSDSPILQIAGSLSLIIGSCALIQQWKIKRFLAYSGISNIGFLLQAFTSSDPTFSSYILYFIIYSFTTVNIFTILLLYGNLSHMSQLGRLRNPYLSIALALNLFSLAGRYVC